MSALNHLTGPARSLCVTAETREYADQLMGSLTEDETRLIAAAYEAGRNAAVASLRSALGLGATFDRRDLERWAEREREYHLTGTLAPTSDQLSAVCIIAGRHQRENEDWD